MSYHRPESISHATTILLRAASALSMVASAALIVAGFGGDFLWGSLGSGIVSGGISLAGWRCASAAETAREYNNEVHEALDLAEKTGKSPQMPPSPYADPDKQPSEFTSFLTKFGGIVMGGAGTLALLASGGEAMWLLKGVALLTGGFAMGKSAQIADDSRQYADDLQIIAQKRKRT